MPPGHRRPGRLPLPPRYATGIITLHHFVCVLSSSVDVHIPSGPRSLPYWVLPVRHVWRVLGRLAGTILQHRLRTRPLRHSIDYHGYRLPPHPLYDHQKIERFPVRSVRGWFLTIRRRAATLYYRQRRACSTVYLFIYFISSTCTFHLVCLNNILIYSTLDWYRQVGH